MRGEETFEVKHAKGPGFVIKDSGNRQEYASGMVRDSAEKTEFTRILDGPMVERWAAHLTKGAKKYPDLEDGRPNWTLANGEAELRRFRESAFRHFLQWLEYYTDEDHAAAVMFNINGAEYVKDRLRESVQTPDPGNFPPKGGD